MQKYTFRFFRDYRDYIETDTFDTLRHELRQWEPCNTIFRAISQGNGRYIVLKLSPYIIGPLIEGYLTMPDIAEMESGK